MTKKTMGEIIAALRKEKGMTQAELAKEAHVTDKAVSKWERDLSCPDISLLPRLAEIFGVDANELLNTKAPVAKNGDFREILDILFKAVGLAMGVAVVITRILNPAGDSAMLLGIGLTSLGLDALINRS
jgi:transcriptional regulator with XRE-family HTH domain